MSNDNTVPSTEQTTVPIQQGTEIPATIIQSMPLGKIAKAKMKFFYLKVRVHSFSVTLSK